jgi:hypothetical protein
MKLPCLSSVACPEGMRNTYLMSAPDVLILLRFS